MLKMIKRAALLLVPNAIARRNTLAVIQLLDHKNDTSL